jgi:hypothetical protein
MTTRRATITIAVGAVVLLAVAGAVFATGMMRSATGAERIRRLATWPPDCSFKIRRPSGAPVVAKWHGVSETASIVCETLGPSLQYARFPNLKALRGALTTSPPTDPYCVARHEVVVDELFSGGFRKLCNRMQGTLHPANQRY